MLIAVLIFLCECFRRECRFKVCVLFSYFKWFMNIQRRLFHKQSLLNKIQLFLIKSQILFLETKYCTTFNNLSPAKKKSCRIYKIKILNYSILLKRKLLACFHTNMEAFSHKSHMIQCLRPSKKKSYLLVLLFWKYLVICNLERNSMILVGIGQDFSGRKKQLHSTKTFFN